MDSTVVIAWITLALSLVGGLLGLLYYINSQIDQERIWREAADEEERKARERVAQDDQNRYAIMYREFSDYKLYVAQNHVTSQALRETEERLIASFEKITSRLETIVARLDRMSVDLARSGMGHVGK